MGRKALKQAYAVSIITCGRGGLPVARWANHCPHPNRADLGDRPDTAAAGRSVPAGGLRKPGTQRVTDPRSGDNVVESAALGLPRAVVAALRLSHSHFPEVFELAASGVHARSGTNNVVHCSVVRRQHAWGQRPHVR